MAQEQVTKRGYKWGIILFGLFIIIAGFGTELMSSSNGLGPYQLWIILVGILIMLLGLFKFDTLPSSIILILLSIVITALPIEIAAKYYLKANPSESLAWRDHIIPDETLRFRIAPNRYEHDANGWRNPTALDTASIVVLGDSQTWSMNAKLDEAWPLVVGDILDTSVYSLAIPGYAPADYYTLFEQEALQLEPTRVIIGFYLGNDLVETFERVYEKVGYTQWQDTTLDVVAASQSRDEIIRQANSTEQIWQVPPSIEPAWIRAYKTTAQGQLLASRNLIPDFSTGGSLRTVYDALPPDDPHRLNVYFNEQQDLYFLPLRRSAAMDPTQLAVQEGDRLAQLLFADMQALALEHNIQLTVVLFPTKELVYANLVEEQHGQLSATYADMIAFETHWRETYTDFLTQQGIMVIDGLIPLQAAAEAEEQIYIALDGHPIASGYRVLAEYVAQELSAMPSPE